MIHTGQVPQVVSELYLQVATVVVIAAGKVILQLLVLQQETVIQHIAVAIELCVQGVQLMLHVQNGHRPAHVQVLGGCRLKKS